eukprot:GGOE01043961.1.p1 GENE.GGOE01043961.1~~GGOE01043961.1.p1  ORF type:complete len:236 (+),score=51.72 GGOE01043961.1:44-751(+)
MPDSPPDDDGGGASMPWSDAITIEPKESHRQTILFLHDHGAKAADWEMYMSDLADALPHARIILPAAPQRPVTKFAGETTTAWFDLEGFEDVAEEPCAGLEATVRGVEQVVGKEEASGIPRHRIVIGGFAEGAAIALYAALHLTPPIGGAVALSGCLLRPHQVPRLHTTMPILLCHGAADRIVEEGETLSAQTRLRDAGYGNVTAKLYPGLGHWTQLQEWADVRDWLAALFLPTA